MTLISKTLQKFKLQEIIELELKLNQKEFISKMRAISDEGFCFQLAGTTDSIPPKAKENYIANFSQKHFELRKTRASFKFKNPSIVKGNFEETGSYLKIRAKITSMFFIPLIIRVVILLTYGLTMFILLLEIILMTLTGYDSDINANSLLPPIILSFIIYFFVFIPIVLRKKKTLEMKKELTTLFLSFEN